ncbi:YciI family protein [Agrilutibacter solisilvae]|nr:YciI family protein [Lysobacter solisilvae]
MSILAGLVRRFHESGHPARSILETTMRFLSMVRVNENCSLQPSEQLMADMGRLIEEMKQAGVLLDTAGLRPTAESVRVRLSAGQTRVIDGPFAETKEVVGGFAILEAASREEAIALTHRFLRVHGDEWEIECEVRQMEEAC